MSDPWPRRGQIGVVAVAFALALASGCAQYDLRGAHIVVNTTAVDCDVERGQNVRGAGQGQVDASVPGQAGAGAAAGQLAALTSSRVVCANGKAASSNVSVESAIGE